MLASLAATGNRDAIYENSFGFFQGPWPVNCAALRLDPQGTSKPLSSDKAPTPRYDQSQ
jgi:hypothetical protein